jgi:V8-like Glu-specific endopeptidase
MGICCDDRRQDLYEVVDEQIRISANSVVAILDKEALLDTGDGTSLLKVKSFGSQFNLCKIERFFDQPTILKRLFNGVLVKENLVATAGHAVSERDLENLRFIFGFKMLNSSTAATIIANENIYRGIRIIKKVHTRTGNLSDWALVKLDREVAGHPVAKLSEGEISPGQPIYMMGHPAGLPLKYVGGAIGREANKSFFSADLSVSMGHSGSPVFDNGTHKMIGILVRGYEKDFRWTGNGWISVIYPNQDIQSKSPQCTRVSEFINDIHYNFMPPDLAQNIIDLSKNKLEQSLDRNYKFVRLHQSLNIGQLTSGFASQYSHALLQFSIDAPDIVIRFFTLGEVISTIKTCIDKKIEISTISNELFAQYQKFRTRNKTNHLKSLAAEYNTPDDFKREVERFNNWFCYFQHRSSNSFEREQYEILIQTLEEAERVEEEREKMERKYDVALSFAGEDRYYVKQVAEILNNSGIKVFYDEFEPDKLWGKNLFDYLSEIYRDQARYTIMFCSKNYTKKIWTNHERKSAQERSLKEKEEYILPARFDDTEIPGLSKTIGYINLMNYTPYEFCLLIAKKLNVKIQNKNKVNRNLQEAVDKILKEENSLALPERERRNIHWDTYQKHMTAMNDEERFDCQKRNSLYYLDAYGMSTKMVKEHLASLEYYQGEINDQFTKELVGSIEHFQRLNNLRHVDGMIGQLTLKKIEEKLNDKFRK